MTTSTSRSCRICGVAVSPFMTFGRMPIANGFLTAEETASEYFYELAPAVCAACGTFQLVEQPDADRMFHDHYAFYSSSSRRMQEHFKRFADDVMSRFLSGRDKPLVVEIGSNDGILLGNFRDAGYRHVGIEPSANVAEVARSRGITTINEFFSEALAARVLNDHGPAEAVVAANVMCHIGGIHDVAAAVRMLLADDGVLIFEDPYLGDLLAKTSYDQIYDEHVFMFSATSVTAIFARHGLELIDVVPVPTHGGSMRYTLAPAGSRPVNASVQSRLEAERQQGLTDPATYTQFRLACESSRANLKELLERIRREGKRVVGYGATSKSTTITNYCGIGPELVEFISDTTPIKQGKLSPGTHIPVKSYEDFLSSPPEYALLFAWNHAAEIFDKERQFAQRGGKWITYVPAVGIIEPSIV